ncbi:hypothetical protein WJ02_14615 [Burkholderia vietnamiensis]|nr:hypothetical protein WJ02_14615 [Burkholderia vietnamiensis]
MTLKHLNPSVSIRFRYFDSNVESPPDRRIKQGFMISDRNGKADLRSTIDALKQRINYSLNLSELVWIIANFGNSVKFIQK